MHKIHPDHPHSPTPSLATVPKVNKNALFPTIFTSRDRRPPPLPRSSNPTTVAPVPPQPTSGTGEDRGRDGPAGQGRDLEGDGKAGGDGEVDRPATPSDDDGVVHGPGGEATVTTTKSPPTQNLRFVPHPRRARKVAFYALFPYKKFPVGMTNLDTNIFSRKSIRFEVGGYVRRGL